MIGLRLWDLGGKGLYLVLFYFLFSNYSGLQSWTECARFNLPLEKNDLRGLLNQSSFSEEMLAPVCSFEYLLTSLYHILRWHKIDLEKHKTVADIT